MKHKKNTYYKAAIRISNNRSSYACNAIEAIVDPPDISITYSLETNQFIKYFKPTSKERKKYSMHIGSRWLSSKQTMTSTDETIY